MVGNRTRAKVVKNKLAPPFRSAEFDVIYGQGISKEGSLLDVGLVKKSGAWFTYDGDQLGQGRENARNFLRDNPELAREIEEKVKAQLGIGVPPQPRPRACMPCSFGLLPHPRSGSRSRAQRSSRVTVMHRCIPLVTAAYGMRVARPARTTRLAPEGNSSQLA